MKLFGRNKSKTTKYKNGENVPKLGSSIILLYIFSNSYQQDSRVLHIFIADNSLGKLPNISPKSFIFLETVNLKLSYIEYDKINITLVID